MEINQGALYRALLKMLGVLRADRIESLQLWNEVAALRNTLQELSGDRFLPIVERHRKKLQEATAAEHAAEVSSLDEIVHLVVAALPGSSV
jgi:hypothetical protein